MAQHLTRRGRWFQRIGPGLITACVVIGPGSILTSSSVGANRGYAMLWIVVVSVLFMMAFMTLGARLGVVTQRSPATLLRELGHRRLARLVGLVVFFISAAFQAGNNIGVAAAFEAFSDSKPLVASLVVVFNAVAIGFLFAFRDFYRTLERIMMAFVALMLLSFAMNLFKLGINPRDMLLGLVPAIGELDLAVLGLIGTTFVVTAAYYQAYLVQQRGWQLTDLADGLLDVKVSAIVMAMITIMLMSTAAAGLYDASGPGVVLKDPVAVAEALEPTFGAAGKAIFCLGLFSAAYSSFIVNSMVGGFVLADGLGWGNKSTDLWPRLFTLGALLIGMAIALATMLLNFDRTPTIILAQAVTVVGAPLIAGTLLYLSGHRGLMGAQTGGRAVRGLACLGFVVLLAMAANTALVKLPEQWRQYRKPPQASSLPSTRVGVRWPTQSVAQRPDQLAYGTWLFGDVLSCERDDIAAAKNPTNTMELVPNTMVKNE